jgi:hypothetical protein
MSESSTSRSVKRKRESSELSIGVPPFSGPDKGLTTLPLPVLLVTLPGLIIHPPNHRYHAYSLCLALLAVRRCLKFPNLPPDIQCRAWTALAEVGMTVIAGGFSDNDDHPWAKGIQNDVSLLLFLIDLILIQHSGC